MDIILVGADWCAPCKAFKLFAKENDIKIKKTYDIDTEDGAEFGQKYGIRAVPTIMTFEDDTEVSRFVGMNPDELSKLKKLKAEQD